MDATQFAYWLQGFAELQQTAPTEEQWKSIKDHLNLVFNKVTPQVGAQPVLNPGVIPSTVSPLVLPGIPTTAEPFRWHQLPHVTCSVKADSSVTLTC